MILTERRRIWACSVDASEGPVRVTAPAPVFVNPPLLTVPVKLTVPPKVSVPVLVALPRAMSPVRLRLFAIVRAVAPSDDRPPAAKETAPEPSALSWPRRSVPDCR